MNRKGLAPLIILAIVLIVGVSSYVVIKNVANPTGNTITGNVVNEGSSGSSGESDSNEKATDAQQVIELNSPPVTPEPSPLKRMTGSVGRNIPIVPASGGSS